MAIFICIGLRYPVPCHLIGEPELVYVYFGVGFLIPIFALIYVQFEAIKNFVLTKIRNQDCTCKRAESGAETEEKAELADDLHVDPPAVDRLEALAEAKLKRSWLEIFLTEASSAQTTLGQIMVRGVIFHTLNG